MNGLLVFLPSVRRRSMIAELCVYTAGAVIGACGTVALGLVAAGLVSPVPSGARTGLIGLACGALVLREWGIWSFPLPSRDGQIPESVPAKGYPLGHFQFGFEMGTGLRTFLPSGAPHLLMLVVILMPASPLMAACAGIGFGLGRAANLWIGYYGNGRLDLVVLDGNERLFRATFATLSILTVTTLII